MRASRIRNRAAPGGGGGGTLATLSFVAGTPFEATASVTASDPVAYPTGMTSGDYTILVCALNGSTGTITAPVGWAELLPYTQGVLSTSAVHAIFYRAYASGDTEPVVSCKSGRLAVLPVRVRGADPATLLEVPATVNQQTVAGTTIDAPAVTSTTSNVMCCTFMGRSSSSGIFPTFTPPGGVTEVGEATGQAVGATNAGVSFNISDITPGASSGFKTGTASSTLTGGMGVSFVLKRGTA